MMAVCGGLMGSAVAEEVTLTTYYPSPRGVYKELRVQDDGAAPSAAALQVTQRGSIPALRVDDQDADATPFVVDQDGHVLIGTTVLPATDPKLYVVGPVEADAFRAYEQSGTYAFLEAGPNDGWAQLGGASVATGTFANTFVDGSVLALQARSGGNVGIGITNPAARLHVAGTLIAEPLCTVVTASGSAPTYASQAVCPAGYFAMSGGGSCADAVGSYTGGEVGQLHANGPMPGLTGWQADCWSNMPGSSGGGDVPSTAYAVCCRKQ